MKVNLVVKTVNNVVQVNANDLNPNSEIGARRSLAIRGAHAAGVPFSAARRKPRPAQFRSPQWGPRMGDDSLGGPPKLARGPRALPVPTSEIGLNTKQHNQMKTNHLITRTLRALAGPALALAALAMVQPAAHAQAYLDTDGATAGFQAANGATCTLSGDFWNPDPSGIGTLAAFPNGGPMIFGAASTDFAGLSFTIGADNNNGFGSIEINSTNANVTLTGHGNNNPGSTWTVAAGSTLNQNNDYAGNVGMNWQGAAVTFAGGGTINLNKMLGFNSNNGGVITENGDPSLVVNLKAAGDVNYWCGFTLQQGTLNFATAASATAFESFQNDHGGYFTINGGTVDNTSGSAMTLQVGTVPTWDGHHNAGGYMIGGSFTFGGTSHLSFNTNTVALTASPTITVNAHTLTIGGIIDDGGNGFGLTKAGGGTLLLNGQNTYAGDTIVSAGTFGGTGTLAGAATFDAGSKAVFTVTPGGPIGNNSTLMTIAGVMTFNANVVHLNLPANLPGGTYVLATSSATPVANSAFPTPVVDSGSFDSRVTGTTITVDTVNNQLVLTAHTTFAGPVKLAITQVNGGANPTAGAPFSVV